MTTSVNVSTVVLANTFDQWRIQTNLLKDDVNEIARGDFTKPSGNVTIPVGSLVLSNSIGTTLTVTANALVSGQLTTANLKQTGSNVSLDASYIEFTAAAGNFHANGNTRTRFLYNNTFSSLANVNASGYIETTGTYANNSAILNVANVLIVRSTADRSNVHINGNLQVSNIATIGNARITLANVTTLNVTAIGLATANVQTLNVNATGATANMANANIANLFTANAIVATANVTTLMNATTANIQTLYVTSLSVTDPISAPSESDSDIYRLRVSQATRGIGTFGVFQGTTNGNASIRFTTTGNVWQVTANDLQAYSTVISTANIGTTYSTDTANVASLTLVKGANDNAIAAYAEANNAANAVRVSANTGSTIAKAAGINFSNSATITVEVAAGNAGNANVSFSVVGGTAQGATGLQGPQGTTGAQGTTGTSGVSGYNGGTVHEFNTGQTADSDPGNGKFAFNNATPASVTFIYIDQLDYIGVDRSNHYSTFDDANGSTNRGVIMLGSAGSGTDAITFRVTGAVTAGAGYYKIPVAHLSGSLPTNGAVMSMIFAPAGSQGTFGTQGILGPQGTTGATGIQGVQGPLGVQGSIGIQGLGGIQGQIGIQGLQGLQGRQGSTGNNGIQGQIGQTGNNGSQGSTGIQGLKGDNGSNGSQGSTGIQGQTGQTGNNGAQGAQGIAGPVNLSGSGSSSYLAKWSSSTNLSTGTAYESGGTVYSTDFAASSDGRLKTVLGFVDNAVDKVETLNAVKYEWNHIALSLGYNNDRSPELGVLAQEVQAVLPEAVMTDDKGYLRVSYDRLVPVLIEAIKELNARIKTLEGK